MSTRAARRVLLRTTTTALLIAACGSSPGSNAGVDGQPADTTPSSSTLPTGFYDVTSSQKDDGCTGTAVTAPGAPMFEVYTDPTIGPGFDFVHSCSSTTQCPDHNDPFIAQFLVTDPGGGWTGATYAAINGTSCTLVRFGGHVTANGTELRLELERDQLVVTGSSTCDGATAQAHAADLVCTQRRIVTGVPH